MLIPSKVWVVDRWVTFSLNIGNYQNIITFFDENGLSFLTMLSLDFSQYPISLHGKGNSTNLLEYLSNNTDNNSLILQFLNYFLKNIIIISYSSGQKLNFNLNSDTIWQNMTLNVYGTYIPPTTTTTTVLITTTTTTEELTTTTTTEELTTTTTTEELTTTTTTETPTTTTTTEELTTTTTTETPTTTTTTTVIYSIGQTALGGKIAYILQPGDPGYDFGVQHGLIAYTGDTSIDAEWGCFNVSISGADGTAIGTGNQNTIDIMSGCATAGIAARLCGDLDIGGYSDWYLPSKDELNKLYLNKIDIGEFISAAYWSSSESDSMSAWSQNFDSGFQGTPDKTTLCPIRAVRSF